MQDCVTTTSGSAALNGNEAISCDVLQHALMRDTIRMLRCRCEAAREADSQAIGGEAQRQGYAQSSEI